MIPGQDAASRSRLPHAILDRDSRVWKARKIIALLGEERFRAARRILEIGCGSGVIASTLSAMGGRDLEVHAVDVVDNTIDTTGYTFKLVSGTALPFESGYFDIVISNHVIEHVGGDEDQRRHLLEIRRVLASAGVVYLAVPNRWRLVEPHYRLPLLSWLPPSLSDRYVRFAGRGTHYDCLPLGLESALRLFGHTGFASEDVTLRALRETLAIEHPRSRLARAFNRYVPDWIPALGRRLIPTYAFVLRAIP
jgi:SAM-dependent methyltransferase